jgi:hypothetical protein
VLLEQAISRGRMVITEVNEAGSVPYLRAVNQGPWPVLPQATSSVGCSQTLDASPSESWCEHDHKPCYRAYSTADLGARSVASVPS